MERNRSLRIASLGVELGLLQKEEKRLLDAIAVATPELASEAQVQLAQTLEKIRTVSGELFKLRSE